MKGAAKNKMYFCTYEVHRDTTTITIVPNFFDMQPLPGSSEVTIGWFYYEFFGSSPLVA